MKVIDDLSMGVLTVTAGTVLFVPGWIAGFLSIPQPIVKFTDLIGVICYFVGSYYLLKSVF